MVVYKIRQSSLPSLDCFWGSVLRSKGKEMVVLDDAHRPCTVAWGSHGTQQMIKSRGWLQSLDVRKIARLQGKPECKWNKNDFKVVVSWRLIVLDNRC